MIYSFENCEPQLTLLITAWDGELKGTKSSLLTLLARTKSGKRDEHDPSENCLTRRFNSVG
jgi:hypothetical protein